MLRMHVEVSDDVQVRNDVRLLNSFGQNVFRLKSHSDGAECDGHMFPEGNNQLFDLGKPDERWRDIYTQFITASTWAYIGSLECALLTVNSVMSINGNRITQVGAPIHNTDVVVNKSYVDTELTQITVDWESIEGETKPLMYYAGFDNVSADSIVPSINYSWDLENTSLCTNYGNGTFTLFFRVKEYTQTPLMGIAAVTTLSTSSGHTKEVVVGRQSLRVFASSPTSLYL